MSMLSDYQRIVSGPLEKDLRTKLAVARAEIETLKDALYRSMDTTGKQASVIAQAQHLIRSTLDKPTILDPAVNCRNLTRTLQEVEASLAAIAALEKKE